MLYVDLHLKDGKPLLEQIATIAGLDYVKLVGDPCGRMDCLIVGEDALALLELRAIYLGAELVTAANQHKEIAVALHQLALTLGGQAGFRLILEALDVLRERGRTTDELAELLETALTRRMDGAGGVEALKQASLELFGERLEAITIAEVFDLDRLS
jgi:hypothetical protein